MGLNTFTFDYRDDDSCGDCGSNRAVDVYYADSGREYGSFCRNCESDIIENLKCGIEPDEDEDEDEQDYDSSDEDDENDDEEYDDEESED
ncbi:hypothetical protein [Paenibacillus odorifer]|uniref:hypothetical protein n=1 Tax=Paenibacillus odorifer TaxID=189426 RepID=UPI00096EA744|nr:hypothetical protein [Paenibacillus odorifer]OMD67615.1 hypothetical protein BSK50_30055 [Paenibacillus odorifer]